MGFTVKESPFPLLKTSFLDMSSSSSSFEEAKQYHEEEGLMIFHLQECIDYKDEINDLSPTWTEDDVKDSLLPYLNHGQQQEGGKIREDQNDSLVSEEELFEMLLLTPPPTPHEPSSESNWLMLQLEMLKEMDAKEI